MIVYFNGVEKKLDTPLSLADFLKNEKQIMDFAAIAINHEFVPKSDYAKKMLQDGDRIECLTPMQGG